MADDDDLQGAAAVFNALGSMVRLRMLNMLMTTKKPLHIKAVSRGLKMDYAAVYRHVNVLRKAQILTIYEVGRSRVLSPVQPQLIQEMISRTKLFKP